MYDLRLIAPNFDGSCPCCSGSVQSYAESKYGDVVAFRIHCWRSGTQPSGVGIAVFSSTASRDVLRTEAEDLAAAVLEHWPGVDVWVSGVEENRWQPIAQTKEEES